MLNKCTNDCKIKNDDVTIVNAKSFGAQGDGKADDREALLNWFAAVCSGSCRGYLPAGRYKCTAPLIFDLSLAATQGRFIYGDGAQQSIIDLTSVTSSPAMLLQCTGGAHWVFYWKFSDFGIIANTNGTAFSIGRFAGTPSGLDQINSSLFERIVVNNINQGTNCVAIQVNGVFSSSFHLVVSNCASTANGDSWQINNSAHSTYHTCAGGNAKNAMHITNFYSYGNVFFGTDLEVCTNCLTLDTASGGSNTFIGGQWHYSGYGIFASPTSGNEIIAPNVSANVNNFIANGFGCRVRSPPLNIAFATPAFPVTNVPCRNTSGLDMYIYVFPGTSVITNVLIGSTSLKSGTVVSPGPYLLRATQIITFVYTSGPGSWIWTSSA
jgi:hypothetical protein